MRAATDGEVAERGREGLAETVVLDPPDEAGVEPGDRRPELDDVAQAAMTKT